MPTAEYVSQCQRPVAFMQPRSSASSHQLCRRFVYVLEKYDLTACPDDHCHNTSTTVAGYNSQSSSMIMRKT